MDRPVVGIVPLYDEFKESYWMLPGYMTMLERSGALPLMFPLTKDKAELDQCFSICDGILFPGGHDVDPAIYGQEKKDSCGALCRERDRMESYLLDLVIEADKPLLGICRGIQFINASLGGTIYQDLAEEHPSETDHHMTPPYDRAVHTVNIRPGTLLSSILESANAIPVNSYHHQAVKDLSPKLRPDAVSSDGLVEAVDMPDMKFFLAVQWHPEFSFNVDENSRKIVRAFVRSMR